MSAAGAAVPLIVGTVSAGAVAIGVCAAVVQGSKTVYARNVFPT
jgi:hypothetical protein